MNISTRLPGRNGMSTPVQSTPLTMPSASPAASSGTGRSSPSSTTTGIGCPASQNRAVRRAGSTRTIETVANTSSEARSLTRTLSRAGSTCSGATPESTRVRQAMRRQTPSAASSGPWPATSPITANSAPSARSTTS